MYPTVADVLALPVVHAGRPRVVAGSAALDRPVRWVHVAEVRDIAHLLRGGELVLTTGIALPDDAAELAGYMGELAGVPVAGLVVEMLRHWVDDLPPALVEAAERHGIPLITLSVETRFVTVTEAVNGLIVDAQVTELKAAEQVHEVFTALTVAGAEPAAVLAEVARITGAPVVLETLTHEVLAYDSAGVDPGELLGGWAARWRTVRLGERTEYHAGSGTLVTVVGARGHDWGRLALLCPEPPPRRHVVVAERAASALAVHRLLARDPDGLERQAHRGVLTELLAGPAPSAELRARAAALGVPLTGRQLTGLAIRPRVDQARVPAVSTPPLLRELAEAVALAARRARVGALVAATGDSAGVRVLLSLSPQATVDGVLGRLSAEVHRARTGAPSVIGVGTVVDTPAQARRSLVEAGQVAAAALHSAAVNATATSANSTGSNSTGSNSSGDGDPVPGPGRDFHRLHDVRLRGLLHLLESDERVLAFAERELGPLLARDGGAGGRLVQALRHYCEQGGNKSAAAAAAHTSRTAYYQQLARIEQVLGVRLEQPESMLSLYVALLAHDVRTGRVEG